MPQRQDPPVIRAPSIITYCLHNICILEANPQLTPPVLLYRWKLSLLFHGLGRETQGGEPGTGVKHLEMRSVGQPWGYGVTSNTAAKSA